MSIDYSNIIRKYVEPKLAYHGFKYSEDKSHPATGLYKFIRIYWGKLQYITISRVEYNLEDVAELIAEDDDLPTEVPSESLMIQEPNYRLWLSNRYITAVIGDEGGGVNLIKGNVNSLVCNQQPPVNVLVKEQSFTSNALQERLVWWEFCSEAELREILSDIVKIILNDGLEWFEGRISGIRRHHEKLDVRRKVEGMRGRKSQKKQ